MENNENIKENVETSNRVHMIGTVVGGLIADHEYYGEAYYRFLVRTKRTSGVEDTVPCLISDHLCDIEQIKHGTVVDINGQFRSHNHRDQKEKRRKLQLNVFVMDIQFIEETNHEIDKIWLDGYLCKEPEYRVTPCGREVTDILVAVNRAYGKSDYIPCICWGRNAIYASGLKVGTYLQCKGRIQSRVFMKEGNAKTAYEVSLVSLKAIM